MIRPRALPVALSETQSLVIESMLAHADDSADANNGERTLKGTPEVGRCAREPIVLVQHPCSLITIEVWQPVQPTLVSQRTGAPSPA